MNKYSYSTIANLIRAQYADNKINESANIGQMAKHDAAFYANEYLNTKMTEVDANGDMRCCCSRYINDIYADINRVTGVDLSDRYEENAEGKLVRRGLANIRKRLLNIRFSYESKSGKAYEPKAEYKVMIAKYLGCSSWNEVCGNAEEMLDEMVDFFHDVADGSVQPSVKKIVVSPKAISQCYELTVSFANGGKMGLFALGGCEFRVVKSMDTVFSEGDVISISDHIVVGNRLAVDVISSRNGMPCSLWLSPFTVRSFKVSEPYTRMIA